MLDESGSVRKYGGQDKGRDGREVSNKVSKVNNGHQRVVIVIVRLNESRKKRRILYKKG